MSKENKLIPELRFPEYDKNGEWIIDTLGSLVEIKGRIGYRGYTTADIVEKGKGAITLSPSNFDENGKLNFDNCTYISWEKYKESPEIILEEGQTVLVKTASVGKSAYVENLPEKTTINPQIVVLKPQKIEPKFLAYTIFHNYIQNQIRKSVGVGAIPNMSQESISNFEILLPPDEEEKEQQKIASCLSSLDELIAAHKDKLEALKDHKKGLMQNLFPQEGQNLPNYRFPEFEGNGEWKIKKVEDFFYVGSSKRVLQKDWTNEGIPFYRTRELVSLSKNEPFGSEIYISENLYEELKVQYGVPKDGDFLVSGVGTLGISYQVKIDDKFYFKDGNVLWFKLEGDLDSSYFKYCFESDHIQKQIIGQTSKSTVGTYTITNAKKTEFWYTKNPKEQKKIASCLSVLDELIRAQSEKIEQLQQHKKGLMQGLFPKINK